MPITTNPINFDNAMSSPEQAHNFKNMSPAKAMILKLSHPPTTVPELEGIPTNDARTQVVTQWRNNDIVKTPTRETEKGVTEPTDWSSVADYSLIIPTGARVQYIGAYYGRPGVYAQDVANTKIQDNFDFKVWQSTVNQYRPIYKSTSLYANVTAFNNIGTINCQQFNPAILFAGTIVQFSYTHPLEFSKFVQDGVLAGRIQFCQQTSDDINPAPIEHYFRTSGQKKQGLDLNPSTLIQVLNVGKIGYTSDDYSIVPTPSQINSNSMRSYAGKFSDGVFTVNRLNTIAPTWLAGSRPDAVGTQLPGLYECYTYVNPSNSAQSFTPLAEQVSDGKSSVLLDTLWSSDMTWSYIRIQGLSSNVNLSTNNAGPVAIKQYYGFEAQPVWGGPWNGLSRESPKPDLAAMQALMDTFYGMPDGMEVKYNFLGTILPFLKGLIPTGISFLKGLFTGKKSSEKESTASSAGDTVGMLAAELRKMRANDGPITTVRPPVIVEKPRIKRRPIEVRTPVMQRARIVPAATPTRATIRKIVSEVVSEKPPRRNHKKLPKVTQYTQGYPKHYHRG